MPAGPIGSSWASGSWSDTAWEANTWAGSAPPTGPTIITTSLPPGVENVAYSQTLHATGGVLPYTWTVDSGALPDGLTLHSGTGVIDGTPTVPNVFAFVIKVTDDDANEDTQPLSIIIFAAGGTGQTQASRHRHGHRSTWSSRG